MQSPRRHKFTAAGFFYLIYSIVHVYSEKTTSKPLPTLTVLSTTLTKLNEEGLIVEIPQEDEINTEFTGTTFKPRHIRPTFRPQRENCTPPTIEQFPRPLIDPYVRKHGGIIIHILVAMFTFIGLATVCKNYFVGSLERICEELKLSSDVAGATFMAAGSSAPELVIAIVAMFVSRDDIGVSGVIGSAVFNIMFVISVCALCTVSHLNWWPLWRDCFFYAMSIMVMHFVTANGNIRWYESLIMLLMYVVYCVALHFDPQLERWIYSLNLPIKLPTKKEQTALVTYNSAAVPDSNATVSETESTIVEKRTPIQPITTNQFEYNSNMVHDNSSWDQQSQSQPVAAMSAAQEKTESPARQAQITIQATGVQNQTIYKPNDTKIDHLIKPTDAGVIALVSWCVAYPFHYMCQLTIPDCKSEKYRNRYLFAFFVSTIWISFYSYFMVWMITIIGNTLGIPDTVMCLTFVAAGMAAPDALNSIAVIKKGYGDMAVSNAVGSNVFAILICLGLPWFIQTAIIRPGSSVYVNIKGLTYSLSLLSTVVFLLLATHLNGWKLDRKYGVMLMVLYLIFIMLASLYELNVFGRINLAECVTAF